MSAAIVEFWGDYNGAVLANSAIARPISLPADWTNVMIGMLYSFTTGSQSNISGPPRIAFGLCSGGTAIYGDVSASLFVGVQNNTTLAYASSSLYTSEYYTSTIWRYMKREGTTDTFTSDPVTSTSHMWIVPKRALNFLRISRSGNTYSFQIYYNNSPSSVNYGTFTELSLLKELPSATTPSVPTTEGTFAVGTSYNLTVDEAASGSLDHVNIAWDREESGNSNLIVYAVGVAVVSRG